MIRSFADKETKKLFETGQGRRFGFIARVAIRKLTQLDSAQTLNELSVPPGNWLEALRGNRLGQHSIRINNEFRVCFRWVDDGVDDVEITDYH